MGHSLAAVARGKEYVVSYLRERWWVPCLAVTAFALVRTLWIRWLLLYVVVHTAYVIYVGGDFYSGHRFLMALTPMFGLLVAAGVDRWLARARARSGEPWSSGPSRWRRRLRSVLAR